MISRIDVYLVARPMSYYTMVHVSKGLSNLRTALS